VLETRVAIVVLIVAVLPGVVYTIAYEREVGRWGVGISDRILRFVASSALFQALYALPLYSIWANYLAPRFGSWTGLTDAIRAGEGVPVWLFLLPIGYLGIPFALGTVAAIGVRYRARSRCAAATSRALVGREPAPRAWDQLFGAPPGGAIRLWLRSGGWVGGFFGDASYAAGYPEEPQDLLLEKTYLAHDDGTFAVDEDGSYRDLGSQLLVRFDEIEFLEYFPESEA
jgi:hypothetical protein